MGHYIELVIEDGAPKVRFRCDYPEDAFCRRWPLDKNVEASIKQVEVAQQNEAKAQAELRAKEVSAKAQIVEAEAKAQATVEMARGQAEANRILAESLTEPLLRNAWIEAIKESGNAIVVPDGSTPFVQVPTPTE